MDDTKLLELAGRAAGQKFDAENNPLERDDLALRLAVRLSASIVFVVLTDGPMVQVSLTWNDSFEGCRWNEWLGDAPAAATCRAIVRAAAAIGESMP